VAIAIEDDIDLSAGFRPHGSVHPAGKITAFDEATGLPIVRRASNDGEKGEISHEYHGSRNNIDSIADHRQGEKEDASEVRKPEEMAIHPERKEGTGSERSEGVAGQQQGAQTAGESAKPGGQKDHAEEVKPKYKHGNTQADIPPDSDAGKALAKLRKAIDPADLMGDGLIEDAHITVRYGIDGDTAGVRAYLEKQAPFEASLGKTQAFPPSEHSDGAAPIIVPVESADLRRMEKEIEKHGTFAERSFPEYKPHATVAYVKPEEAKRYTGMTEADGKTFTVKSISISDRDGNVNEVQLEQRYSPAKDPATGRDILHRSTDRAQLVGQAKAHAKQFEDGLKAVTRGIAGAKFDAVRPEKSPERIDEKIKEEGQPVHTIPDILAGRIGVDSRDAHERTIAAVKNHFKVIRDEDEFERGSPPTNYRVHKLQAQVTPQLSAEIHIVPKEVLEANAHQHDVYDAAREADLEGKDATAEKKEKQAKAINDAAMEKFNERNDSEKSSKVEPVKLSKGITVIIGKDSFGIVHGGNPNFSNGGRWSVLSPGGLRTFKGSELQPIPHSPKPNPALHWIGYDVDGSLAHWTKGQPSFKIGNPVSALVERAKKDIADGKDVRLFTAKLSDDPKGLNRAALEAWTYKVFGRSLPMQDVKDDLLEKFYDDRAVHVERNTGKIVA
jgi:2'-5' RNA ligase